MVSSLLYPYNSILILLPCITTFTTYCFTHTVIPHHHYHHTTHSSLLYRYIFIFIIVPCIALLCVVLYWFIRCVRSYLLTSPLPPLRVPLRYFIDLPLPPHTLPPYALFPAFPFTPHILCHYLEPHIYVFIWFADIVAGSLFCSRLILPLPTHFCISITLRFAFWDVGYLRPRCHFVYVQFSSPRYYLPFLRYYARTHIPFLRFICLVYHHRPVYTTRHYHLNTFPYAISPTTCSSVRWITLFERSLQQPRPFPGSTITGSLIRSVFTFPIPVLLRTFTPVLLLLLFCNLFGSFLLRAPLPLRKSITFVLVRLLYYPICDWFWRYLVDILRHFWLIWAFTWIYGYTLPFVVVPTTGLLRLPAAPFPLFCYLPHLHYHRCTHAHAHVFPPVASYISHSSILSPAFLFYPTIFLVSPFVGHYVYHLLYARTPCVFIAFRFNVLPLLTCTFPFLLLYYIIRT